MVELALVEAVDDLLAREAERLEHPERLLLDVIGVEVLRDCAIVHVGELAPFVLIILFII